MSLFEHIEEYIQATEQFIQSLNTSWQATFAHGVHSKEEIQCGKELVEALTTYTKVLEQLKCCLTYAKNMKLTANTTNVYVLPFLPPVLPPSS